MRRSILVTGAFGFLGSWTIAHLAAGRHRVVGVARRRRRHWLLDDLEARGQITIVEADITEAGRVAEILANEPIDFVVHAAADNRNRVDGSPLPLFELNIRGTYLLLEAAREANSLPVVTFTSNEAKSQDNAFQPYAVSKRAVEDMCRSYFATYHLPVALLKPDNLYGPGDTNWNRLIPHIMKKFAKGEEPDLRSPETRRSYLFVADAAEGVETCLLTDATNRVWQGVPHDLPASETRSASEVREAVRNAIDNDSEEPYSKITSARRSIDEWTPRTPWSQGIARTVQWYKRCHGQSLNQVPRQ